MKARLRGVLLVVLSGFVLMSVGCGGGDGGTASDQPLPSTVVSPLALPGPYAVACSNIAQDFSRVAPGEDAKGYWEGSPSADGAPRYVTDLLADPDEYSYPSWSRRRTTLTSMGRLQDNRLSLCCSPAIRPSPTIPVPIIRCQRVTSCRICKSARIRHFSPTPRLAIR